MESNGKNIYSTTEFGALLGITATQIRRLIRSGVIEAELVGRVYAIPRSQLEAAKARPRPGRPYGERVEHEVPGE